MRRYKKIYKNNFFAYNIKPILGILLTVVIINTAVYYGATIYFDGVNVGYDNTNSSITSDNVQDALDELYGFVSDIYDTDTIYPVGSVYMSTSLTTPASVSDALGGTWERYSENRTPIGVGDNGTTAYTAVNATGGSESESYTPTGTNKNMAVTFNTSTLAHSGGKIAATTLTANQLPRCTGYISTVFTTSSIHGVSGAFTATGTNANSYENVAGYTASGAKSIGTINFSFGSGQSHTHTYTELSSHSYTPTVSSYTNPTFTGNKMTINHMQPYVMVYMYKRVS